MLRHLVERWGAWRAFSTGCEVLGFPPTWDITRRQADNIERALNLQDGSLLWAIEQGIVDC